MKLRLPLSVWAALSAVISPVVAYSANSPSGDLGNVMYIGDSITHGVNGGSYRWSLHKIWADNGIGQTAVGVNTGNFSGGVAAGTSYGGIVFNNVHSSQSSANAYHIAGVDRNIRGSAEASKFFGGSNIKNWLGQSTTTTTGNTYTGTTFTHEKGNLPDTFMMMIGTNDTLSDYAGKGIGAGTNMAKAQAQMIGTTTGDHTWSGTGDIDTIVDAMKGANPDANVILLTIPCWVDGRANNNNAADFAAIAQYNEKLADWAAWKGVTLVDVNEGLLDVARTDKPGAGVASMFGNDRLHPNAQGDLLIAGNIAKSLGYAGRSAGQARKAATAFTIQTAAVFAGSTHANVTQSGSGLTFASGSSLTYAWSAGADMSQGWTMDFSVAIGNGATGGWNTSGNLSLTLGNGDHMGRLNINEAYIKWGDTILYSTDMSANTDSIRIAYVFGNSAEGLSSGYYVWLGDMMIGEALGDIGADTTGLTITNGTGSSVTIGDLALDASGSWAPATEGFVENQLIIPQAGSPHTPGTIAWKTSGFDTYQEDLAVSNNVRSKVDSTAGSAGKVIGGTVSSGNATFYANSGNYTGDIWVTVTGSAKSNGGFNGGHTSGSLTGSLYLRLLDSAASDWKTIFGAVNGTAITGDLYMEFSSPGVTYVGNTFNAQLLSIAGTFATNIQGTTTLVFNSGIFKGLIYGGNTGGATTSNPIRTGSVKLFINGGTYQSGVYAGGALGTVDGDVEITVTGNTAIFKNGSTWGTIGAVTEKFGSGNKACDGTQITGNATITVKDLHAGEVEGGFDKFAGTLSGGRKEKVDGSRTLVFDNTQLTAFGATLDNFDTVTLNNGCDLALDGLGGATQLIVSEGNTLTLTGAEYSLGVSNSGRIALKAGTTLHVTGTGDGNLAGVFHVNGGSLCFDDIDCSNVVDVATGHVAIAGDQFRGSVRINATGAVDMEGTKGSFIKELNTATATTITGISGNVTLENATLTAGIDSLKNAIVSFADNGTLTVTNELTIQIDEDLLAELKARSEMQDYTATLHIANAGMTVNGTVMLTQTVGLKLVDAPSVGEDGTISFICKTTNIFCASDIEGGNITGYDGGGIMKDDGTSNFISTVIDNDLTITLPGAGGATTYPDGLLLNNFEGKEGTTLTLKSSREDETATVTLNNHQFKDNLGADTTFLGDLNAMGTDVVKTGEGTLTLGGGVSIGSDNRGSLHVEEGTLVLNQKDGNHHVQTLVLEQGSGPAGTLDLQNGSNLTVDTTLHLAEGTLTSTDHTGILTMNAGDLVISEGTVSGINLTLKNGAHLQLAGNASASLCSLSGDDASSLIGGAGARLVLAGNHGVFNGSLDAYQGTLSVTDEAKQTLKGSGGAQMTLQVEGAELILAYGDNGVTYKRLETGTPRRSRAAGSEHALQIDMSGAHGGTLTLTEGASFAAGSVIQAMLPSSYAGTSLFAAGNGATISFDGSTMLNILLKGGDKTSVLSNGIALGKTDQFTGTENLTINLVGYTGDLIEKNGSWLITVQKDPGFTYAAFAQSPNAAAAGRLFDHFPPLTSEGRLGQLATAVDTLILDGRTQEASKLMASAAGTTVTSLGAAQRVAMRDQMGFIRNRLVNPGLDDTVYNEDLPYFHLWVQATGNHAQLDGKRDESGFTLNSWGGSVGFDVDAGEHVNIGLAVTASYGDLDAEGAERASGDFDTWYVNLFTKIKVKRWTHKAVAALGLTDAELNRTVTAGAMSYKAKGSTEGTSYGLMYELTYDTYLNDEETAILQPLLNLSIVNGRIDGYTETGDAGNAALHVGKQTMTTGTVALGARVMGELSTNALGRASFGEFRVNLAQDIGDNRSEADVSLTGAPGATATMRGAKAGTTGVQIGAGLSVPVEEHSSIYLDVNADFRAHASSINGSIGYQYNF